MADKPNLDPVTCSIVELLEGFSVLPAAERRATIRQLREGTMPIETVLTTSDVPGSAFFARPSTEVAKDLLGSQFCRVYDAGQFVTGTITEIDAWAHPKFQTQEDSYSQDSGRIYIYNSSRGTFFAISAHKPGEQGVVRLISIDSADKDIRIRRCRGSRDISTSHICDAFGIDASFDGKPVMGPGLYIARRTVPLEALGLSMRETIADPRQNTGYDGKQTLMAKYELVKK